MTDRREYISDKGSLVCLFCHTQMYIFSTLTSLDNTFFKWKHSQYDTYSANWSMAQKLFDFFWTFSFFYSEFEATLSAFGLWHWHNSDEYKFWVLPMWIVIAQESNFCRSLSLNNILNEHQRDTQTGISLRFLENIILSLVSVNMRYPSMPSSLS